MENWSEINAWRKELRAVLIERRVLLDSESRHVWNEHISALIEAGFPLLKHFVIGFCWPYKAEFDARFTVRRLRDAGAVSALPAVVEKRGPLQFRRWWPGARMEAGVLGIPVPVDTAVVIPDATLVPMNAFDQAGFRLGYGGGYFDRTLAAISPRPLSIGIAYDEFQLPTIYPQPHDIPMDFVVTQRGIHVVEAGRLKRVEPACSARLAEELAAARGLPRKQPAAVSPAAEA